MTEDQKMAAKVEAGFETRPECGIPVLGEIRSRVEQITEEDVARAARELDSPKPNEEHLGTVHNMEARKLWAAIHMLRGEAVLSLHEAKYRSTSKGDADRVKETLLRYKELIDIMSKMFWFTVQDDLGTFQHSVGIRADWMLVAANQEESNVVELLKSALGY